MASTAQAEAEDLAYERPASPLYRPIRSEGPHSALLPVVPVMDDFTLGSTASGLVKAFPSLQPLISAPEAQVISVNESVFAMFGYDPAEVTALSQGCCTPLSPHFAVVAAHTVLNKDGSVKEKSLLLDNRHVVKAFNVRRAKCIEAAVVDGQYFCTDPNIDPICSEAVSQPNDIAVIRIIRDKNFGTYFYPASAAEGANCWLVARHEKPSDKLLGEANVTDAESYKLFWGYDTKCVSAGLISGVNDHVVCAAVSCTNGACGGPLLSPSFALSSFVGICVGGPSAKRGDVSYNRFMSTNHPQFVVNYALHVVPDLPQADHAKVKPFLSNHKALLQHHNCDVALSIVG